MSAKDGEGICGGSGGGGGIGSCLGVVGDVDVLRCFPVLRRRCKRPRSTTEPQLLSRAESEAEEELGLFNLDRLGVVGGGGGGSIGGGDGALVSL